MERLFLSASVKPNRTNLKIWWLWYLTCALILSLSSKNICVIQAHRLFYLNMFATLNSMAYNKLNLSMPTKKFRAYLPILETEANRQPPSVFFGKLGCF
jgi:hypothetical protein